MTLGHSEADLRNEHRIDLDRDHALDLGYPLLEEEVVARMSEGRADEHGPILDADLRAGTVEPGMSLDDLSGYFVVGQRFALAEWG